MTNDVTTKEQSTALASVSSMLGGLRRVARTAPRAVGGDFMRFGKDGVWSFGRENKEVDPGNDFAILNILSMKEGYVCWTDDDNDDANTKLGEEMAPINHPIDVDELPDHGFPWKRQQSIQMKFCEGSYEGTQTIYAPSSQGGLEALGGIVEMVLDRVDQGTPYVFPIVGFDNTWYPHKKWGKTYKPVIDIVGWADENGNEDPEFVAPEPEPAPEPKKPAKRAAAADKGVTRGKKPAPNKRTVKPTEPEPEPEPEPEQEPEQEQAPEKADEDVQPRARRRRR